MVETGSRSKEVFFMFEVLFKGNSGIHVNDQEDDGRESSTSFFFFFFTR